MAQLFSLGGMSTMTTQTLQPKSPKLNSVVFVVWALVSLYAGIYSAAYLWLFQLYGFSRVFSEHLHFTAMPKSGAWVVSNGDQITSGFFVHHFLVALVVWIVIFFTPLFFIYRKRRYAA
jgi:hypothetical protein